MRKWWKQWATEWLLLRRSWWTLLAVLAFGLWMAYVLANENAWKIPNVYTRLYALSYLAHTMTLGVAMLLSILAVRRDTVPRGAEMLETWTLGNGTWLTAKYVALFSYMSLYAVVMTTAAFLDYVQQGIPLSKGGEDIVFLFVQYELSYAVTLALGMALAMWIRHRIVYVIGFCAWMFGTYFMEWVLISRLHLPFLKVFHLSELTLGALWRSDVWGASLVTDELLRSRSFVVLFTAFLLAAVLVTRYQRRPGSGQRIARRGMAVLAIGLIGVGGWYGSLWVERIGHVHEAQAHYADHMEADPYRAEEPPFRIEAYDLDVRQTGERAIEVQASLVIDPETVDETSRIAFTLNHAFDVQRVAVDGEEVAFSREWDTLSLHREGLPSHAGRWHIDVVYAGEVFHHGGTYENLSAFVAGQDVYLPYYTAWYPLPGEQQLYWTYEGGEDRLMTRRDAVIAGPAHVELALHDFPNRVYATLGPGDGETGTQTFSGYTEQGVTLVAGKLEEIAYADVRLITSVTNRPEGERFLKAWHEQVVAYYDAWLFDRGQRNHFDTIFQLPLQSVNSEAAVYIGFAPSPDGHLFLNDNGNLHPTAIRDLSKPIYSNFAEAMIHAYLFGDFDRFSLRDDENNNVTGAVRRAYFYLYAREQLQESHDRVLNSMDDVVFSDDGERTPEQQVLGMIRQAVDRGETSQLKHLLRDVYEVVEAFDVRKYDEQPDQGITWDEWQRLWKEYGLSE